MTKKIICAFGTDIDSVAGWIGSCGGGDSPSDIQRGIFATEVGVSRLLRLFKRYDLQTSFFIPGHSLEAFPEEMRMIVDAGHEVGAHGDLHESPVAMTPTQEEDVLVRSIELIGGLTGRAPRGYVAPWWEMPASTAALLRKYGFSYDHGQGYRDFQPFYARVGDSWTVIDYAKQAKDWMHPLRHGHEIDLVGITANWYVDDLPPMMFTKKAPNSHGFVNPRDVEMIWRNRFDRIHREMDCAVFAFTIHPDVASRPQVLPMLERLTEHINGHDGVEWMTFERIAEDFRARFPFEGGVRPEVLRARAPWATPAASRRRPATGPRPARPPPRPAARALPSRVAPRPRSRALRPDRARRRPGAGPPALHPVGGAGDPARPRRAVGRGRAPPGPARGPARPVLPGRRRWLTPSRGPSA